MARGGKERVSRGGKEIRGMEQCVGRGCTRCRGDRKCRRGTETTVCGGRGLWRAGAREGVVTVLEGGMEDQREHSNGGSQSPWVEEVMGDEHSRPE